MTVALDYTPSFYIADGQTKEFQYNFSLTMTSNLVVFTMDKRGEKTIVDKDLYDFKINPDNTGGAVTFNKAPESGTNVLIARIETPTQEKDWRNTEGFNLKSLTDEFDKLTRWCQELAENNKRSIVVPENKEDDPLDLYNRQILSDVLESVKYLKIENGNLYYSLDAESWTMLPKSAMIQEFRQRTVLDEKQVPRTVFEYRIGDKWYTIDLYPTEVKVDKAVATSEEAKIIAETANAKSDEAVAAIQGAIDAAEAATEAANSVVDTAENALNTATTANEAAQSALTTATAAQSAVASKADKADTYTKAEVDAKVSSVYRFKGSVATYSALPTENNTIGDVWNVEDSGANYAWTGTAWDKLSETIDLTPYLTKNEAGSTYATKDELTSGLAGKVDTISVATATTAGIVRVGDGSQMVVNPTTGDISLDGTKAESIRGTIGAIANNQGTENAGKLLAIDVDGDVVPVDGDGASSGAGRNIGDIFWTTRTDSALNGAVEANGAQYNFADINGGVNNIQSLLENGKLPYININEFNSMAARQGGCDSFGFGYGYDTADLVLYPVYIEQADHLGIKFYTNVSDWFYAQRDSNDVLQGVKIYDKNTYQELVGWYVKYDTTIGLYYIYSQEGEIDNGDGYMPGSSDTVTLPTGGEFQSTTYFKVPKKTPRILVRCQKPTAANDYTWYNLYADGWCEQGGRGLSDARGTITFPIRMYLNDYCLTFGGEGNTTNYNTKLIGGFDRLMTGFTIQSLVVNGNSQTSHIASSDSTWQVSGYADPSEYTKDKWDYQNVQVERPMVQLFNSATDEAVATCTSVLQDVANLNVAVAGVLPIGAKAQYCGGTLPDNFMWCDGSAISRTTYASLFAVIGTKYGAGDGSTTFNLPNDNSAVPWAAPDWDAWQGLQANTNVTLPYDGYLLVTNGAQSNGIIIWYAGRQLMNFTPTTTTSAENSRTMLIPFRKGQTIRVESNNLSSINYYKLKPTVPTDKWIIRYR